MLNQDRKEEKLSEWRQLEKQMMTEDKKIKGSPKTTSGPRKAIEQPKNATNEMEQSYEQIQIELFDDMNQNADGAGIGETKQERHTFHRQTLIIDEALVSFIERSGYPKPYIMASLNNDDLNHITTFYYLLQIDKEY